MPKIKLKQRAVELSEKLQSEIDETDFIYTRSVEWLADVCRTAKQNGIKYIHNDLTVQQFLEHNGSWRIRAYFGWSRSLEDEFRRHVVSQISSWFYDQLESLQLSGEEQEKLWQ